MKFYFAPMEGVTKFVYRNALHAHFDGIDKYFAPFVVTNQSGKLKHRELQDILPENNQGITLIPQILSGNANDFVNTSKVIKELGYDEINLNLGCPSGTVVAKRKGSGMLIDVEELDRFLDHIFAAEVTKISIKTRLGIEDPEEFYKIMEVYNKYKISELIIHPRVQKDFYKNTPNLTVFRQALEMSKNPVCYNGDIFTPQDYQRFIKEFPSVDRVMLGRGIIANPGLINEIKTGKTMDKECLKAFHSELLREYKQLLSGDRNVLFKMKEVWFYLSHIFEDSEKLAKKIRKTEKMADYEAAVANIFAAKELRSGNECTVNQIFHK
ncbi:MAG: tRNA-dihydrouridine synthase family protein [bacterium]|nr:tRNA-dihydrouridine synthase family protein [bacterium]